jgi:beta-carotene hydroxylase
MNLDTTIRKPRIADLGGEELLKVSSAQILLACLLPFVCAAAYFLLASSGNYLPGIGMLVALSYFSYPSVSHDLVHRAYRLPLALNSLGC